MMRGSLRLTSWLMLRYGINVGNVIGHAEILQSPFHRERYAVVALLDPRRLEPRRDAHLPAQAEARRRASRCAARRRAAMGRLGLLRR